MVGPGACRPPLTARRAAYASLISLRKPAGEQAGGLFPVMVSEEPADFGSIHAKETPIRFSFRQTIWPVWRILPVVKLMVIS